MTPPEPATAPRRNVLPLPDLIRLTDWARANPVLCADTSNTKLAIIAGASLTLNVTAANVASVLEACGIEKTKRLPAPTIEERVGLLEEKLALLTGIIQGFREGLETRNTVAAAENLDLHRHLTGEDRPAVCFEENAP